MKLGGSLEKSSTDTVSVDREWSFTIDTAETMYNLCLHKLFFPVNIAGYDIFRFIYITLLIDVMRQKKIIFTKWN